MYFHRRTRRRVLARLACLENNVTQASAAKLGLLLFVLGQQPLKAALHALDTQEKNALLKEAD